MSKVVLLKARELKGKGVELRSREPQGKHE